MKVGVIAMNECQYTKCGKALRPQPETGGRKPQYCDETCRSRQRGAAAQSRRPKTGRCNACGEMFFRRARGRLGNVCPGKPECAAAVRAGRCRPSTVITHSLEKSWNQFVLKVIGINALDVRLNFGPGLFI